MNDAVVDWWIDYEKADVIKRKEMINKLSFINSYLNLQTINTKIKKHVITSLLNTLFDDCINSLVYNKISKEELKKEIIKAAKLKKHEDPLFLLCNKFNIKITLEELGL